VQQIEIVGCEGHSQKLWETSIGPQCPFSATVIHIDAYSVLLSDDTMASGEVEV
jgi:hypothetical protein